MWITNLFFPEFYEVKKLKAPVMGGWMKALADSLTKVDPEIEIAIASPWPDSHEIEELKVGNYTFYTLPIKKNNTKIDATSIPIWKEINRRFKPDIVHIHGSEFTHGYGWIQANGNNNVVLSIQGLISVYARYAEAGIKFDRLKNLTIHDFIRKSYPDRLSQNTIQAGESERILLNSINNVIGRTSWDRDHLWALNPVAKYHFCNENLRSAFYKGERWRYESCQPRRIFLSQAAKPIKGLHKMIMALPLILREYPDTEVYVAGNDFIRCKTIHDRLRYSGFAKYIQRLMHVNNVINKIHFTGFLDADQMMDQYRLANVFVCPSSIENSPNSLGEAQLVGVPVVASYVGGIPDMVSQGETGLLYRFDEHEMLAEKVCTIFSDKSLAKSLSCNGYKAASERHDISKNAKRTIEIYNDILGR